jgi:hypothetical protein
MWQHVHKTKQTVQGVRPIVIFESDLDAGAHALLHSTCLSTQGVRETSGRVGLGTVAATACRLSLGYLYTFREWPHSAEIRGRLPPKEFR